MTVEELKKSNFIVGQKLRVKTEEQIDALFDESKFSHDFYTRTAKRYIGRELTTSSYPNEHGLVKVYTNHPQLKYDTVSIPLDFLEPCGDNRTPPKEAYELAKKLVDMDMYFICATSGEVHGRSEDSLMTADKVYPILGREGESLIHIPNCGQADDALTIDIVQELIENKTYDASFSTGMSFIRRTLKLVSKDKIEKNRYSY